MLGSFKQKEEVSPTTYGKNEINRQECLLF